LLADTGLAKRLKDMADRYSVPIDNYSLNADFLMKTEAERQAEIDRVKSHMDASVQLGVSTFRCDCAEYRRPIEQNTIETFLDELPVIVECYEALCAYAQKYGIKILLENHGFHANGCERVRLILKNVKKSNFGHQLDVGNYICMDDVPEIAVSKMLPFATTIHMKDFYVRPAHKDPGDATQFDCSGMWFRSTGGRYLRGSILNQGDMDIPAIVSQIKTSGYDGNIFIEYEGMEDCSYGTKVSLDNSKKIYGAV
jgi:sugar phosphate isomerase/epimerase